MSDELFPDMIGRIEFEEQSEILRRASSGKLLEDAGAGQVETRRGKVSSVTYPNGKVRQFDYDEKEELVKIKQPNGEIWTKQGHDDWASDGGKKFSGRIAVTSDG